MHHDHPRSGNRFAIIIALAWTAGALLPIIFAVGWTGSLSDVLFNTHGDHPVATVSLWVIALSSLIAWWLALTGRMRNF